MQRLNGDKKPIFYRPILALIVIIFAVSAGLWTSQAAVKERATYWTPERLEIVRENVERYDWARKVKERILKAVEPWMKLSSEELWALVPGPKLPRIVNVNNRAGCPVCGAFGAFGREGAWSYDVFAAPWKVKCDHCGVLLPKNDFGKFYRSGLDRYSEFDPELADRSLLFNPKYPHPAHPKHKYLVDDGFGWVREDGERFLFIGKYTQWGLWYTIADMVPALSRAYVFTGDVRYARKAAILLDRIADVYPRMEHADHRKNRAVGGKIIDSVWENWFTAGRFIGNYDRIVEAIGRDPELVDFLAAQAKNHHLKNPKSSAALIRSNIEDNLIREFLLSQQEGSIGGNVGMGQRSIAQAAMALDDEKSIPEAFYWLYNIGMSHIGGLNRIIVNNFSRDGIGGEGSPAYSLLWSQGLITFAELMEDYGKFLEYSPLGHPKFGRMMLSFNDLILLDRFTPNIGNSGATGMQEIVAPRALLGLFRITGDKRVAKEIYRRYDGDLSGLHLGVSKRDPERIQEEIRKAARGIGHVEDKFESWNLAGYGLAVLQSGSRSKDTGRALWLRYGLNVGPHPHQDMLHLGLHAKGLILLPDLGYPDCMVDPSRRFWLAAPISHNTVTVDAQRQKSRFSGKVESFHAFDGVRVADISSDGLYPGVGLFRRQVSFIDISEKDSYVVDFFRVDGGRSRLFHFTAGAGEVKTEGLNLVKQSRGTFAGEAFPRPGIGEGPKSGAPGMFQYLDKVQHDNSPLGDFTVDWRIKDTWGYVCPKRDIHLRFHSLGRHSRVSLARGIPPRISNAPEWLQYVLIEDRKPEDGPNSSRFVSVFEPYENNPFISRAEKAQVTPANDETPQPPVAVRIALKDGRTDYVFNSLDGEKLFTVGERFKIKGEYCFVRFKDEVVSELLLINAKRFKSKGLDISLNVPYWSGKVVAMDREMDEDNTIIVTPRLPENGALVGQWIIIENDGKRNAAYRIEDVRPKNAKESIISLGDITFIRELRDKWLYTLAARAKDKGDDFLRTLEKLRLRSRKYEAEDVWAGHFGRVVESHECQWTGKLSGGQAVRGVVSGRFRFYFEDLPPGKYDIWALGNSPLHNTSSVYARLFGPGRDPGRVVRGFAIPKIYVRRREELYWSRIFEGLEIEPGQRMRIRIGDGGVGGIDTTWDSFVFVEHNEKIPVSRAPEKCLPASYSRYVYNFEIGQSFTIPGSFRLKLDEESGKYEIFSTSPFQINASGFKSPGWHTIILGAITP